MQKEKVLSMENMSKQSAPKKSGRKLLYALVIVIVAVIIIGSVYYYETTLPPPAGSGTLITLYEGEITSTSYGFGNTSTTLTSNPGPTITLTAGQTYTMTVYNVGTMQHNWAIVDAKSSTANVLWGAVTSPINSQSSGKVTFKAGPAGNYFYICQVPGHVTLGLWGTVVVNPQ
jgi:plastocyanin